MAALPDAAPAITLTASTPDLAPPSPVVAAAGHDQAAATQTTATTALPAPMPAAHPRTRELAAAQKSLKRPPSLSELTQAMRLNPERWSQLKAETDHAKAIEAAASSVSPTGSAPSSIHATIPAGDAASASLDSGDGSVTTAPGADGLQSAIAPRLRLQVSSLQRTTGSRTSSPITAPSNNLSSMSTAPSSSNTSPVGAPTSLPGSSTDESDATTLVSPVRTGRLPSLAAIQERMARAKSVDSTNAPTSSSGASGTTVAAASVKSSTGAPMSTSKLQEVAESDAKRSESLPKAGSSGSTLDLPKVQEPHAKDNVLRDNTAEETQKGAPRETLTAHSAEEAKLPTIPNPAKPPLHPLQHRWVLYFDSKATAASARRAATTNGTSAGTILTPDDAASTPPLTPLGAGGQAYQAALQKVGEFKTVEDFCRYFNWTKKPSQLNMQSSIQLFKANIKPMWEDPANENGGKWTLTMKTPNLPFLDQLWTYLVLGLVGEEIDVHDDVCGAVVATRPRGNRIQVWVRDKTMVERVNGLGKRLIKLLEIKEDSGVAVDFSPHSGNSSIGASKFISIAGNLPPMARPPPPTHSLSSGSVPSSMRPTIGPGVPGSSGVPGPFPFAVPTQRIASQPNGSSTQDGMFWRAPSTDSNGSSQGIPPPGNVRRPTDPTNGPPQRPPLMIHHSHHIGMAVPPGMKAIIVPGPPPGAPHGGAWRPVSVGMVPPGSMPPGHHPPPLSNGSTTGAHSGPSMPGGPPHGPRRAASFVGGIPGVATLIPITGPGLALVGQAPNTNNTMRSVSTASSGSTTSSTSPQPKTVALPPTAPQSVGLGIGGT